LGIDEAILERMPATFEDAKKKVKACCVAYREVHFCKNGCMKFESYKPGTKKEDKDLFEICTTCGDGRFDEHGIAKYNFTFLLEVASFLPF
jgi:hypothetical protein